MQWRPEFKIILNYVTRSKGSLGYTILSLKKPRQENILQGLKERKLNLIPQMASLILFLLGVNNKEEHNIQYFMFWMTLPSLCLPPTLVILENGETWARFIVFIFCFKHPNKRKRQSLSFSVTDRRSSSSGKSSSYNIAVTIGFGISLKENWNLINVHTSWQCDPEEAS